MHLRLKIQCYLTALKSCFCSKIVVRIYNRWMDETEFYVPFKIRVNEYLDDGTIIKKSDEMEPRLVPLTQ